MIASIPTHRASQYFEKEKGAARKDDAPLSSRRSTRRQSGFARELVAFTALAGSWLIADATTTPSWATCTRLFGVNCLFLPTQRLDTPALDTIFELMKLVGRSCDVGAMRERELAIANAFGVDDYSEAFHIVQRMKRNEYNAFAERASRRLSHILLDAYSASHSSLSKSRFIPEYCSTELTSLFVRRILPLWKNTRSWWTILCPYTLSTLLCTRRYHTAFHHLTSSSICKWIPTLPSFKAASASPSSLKGLAGTCDSPTRKISPS
jgi:hypothetical protein